MKTTINAFSKDSDELAEFFSSHYAPVDIRSHDSTLEIGLTGKAAILNDMSLEWTTTIGSYDILPNEELDAIFLSFQKSGALHIHSGDGLWAQGGDIVSLDAREIRSVYTTPGSEHTTIGISRGFYKARIDALIDGPAKQPFEFAAKIDSTARDTVLFTDFIHALSTNPLFDLEHIQPSAVESFSNFIFDMAIQVLPNSHSELLRKSPPRIASRQVKRALEYIHAHLQEWPKPEFLAENSGVSLRALQYSFKEATGSSIMEYQKSLRLKGAKKDLYNDLNSTIEMIARRWGFSNTGRFSQQFLHMFGETPMQLRRSLQQRLTRSQSKR